jgi:error-prone DNA polymerase
MIRRGYDPAFAERCFRQIEGFGEYGFPESHAASFALLVYVSAWLKCHTPAAFACALLNSQPMGFYAPAQIIRDAREHGVRMLPLDANASDWDCTLERDRFGIALRLGFRQAKGLAEAEMRALVAARGLGFADMNDLWRRCGGMVKRTTLEALANADGFAGFGLNRREALWAIKGLCADPLPLFAAAEQREEEVRLADLSSGEQVLEDYAALRLSLRDHPLALLRRDLTAAGIVPAARLASLSGRAKVAGLVTVRQRPGTASGVIFITMEDETGVANIIVWPRVFERYRREVLGSTILCVDGRVQKDGEDGDGLVIHVVADRLSDETHRLKRLRASSRDFC